MSSRVHPKHKTKYRVSNWAEYDRALVQLRDKSMVGDRLRARHPKSQEAEALIACNILNRMTEPGRSESFAIGP
jgi:hypothetical protein